MPLRLFIVEDQADAAASLAELLTADGTYEAVGFAESEADALAWSFQNEAGFDLAIVDLILRSGSGFAVVHHMQKYQPGQVVVLSDFVTSTIAERCKAMGAAAAFRKSDIGECVRFARTLASRKAEGP